MASLDAQLRALVRTYLDAAGMSGRRFALEALGDPGFVASLKRGRRLTLSTADRLLAYMGEPPAGPAFRREAEAFMRATRTKPYVFGEQAVHDAGFVERLRRGASFRLSTVDRARAWMRSHADEAARAAMRRAVAGVPLLGGDAGEDIRTSPASRPSTSRSAARATGPSS